MPFNFHLENFFSISYSSSNIRFEREKLIFSKVFHPLKVHMSIKNMYKKIRE